MDYSDIIRRMQAQTNYTYLKINTLATQPTCNFSTCTTISGCAPINYITYEQKNNIQMGKYYCNSCSTTNVCSLS
jgi:hypothetical protein